jgi:diguanylate cyclase (GGDEF)-like protein
VSSPELRSFSPARRPGELVEATRWLFGVLTLGSLLIALLAALALSDMNMRFAAVISALVLAVSCIAVYLLQSAPLILDLVDSAALLALALASPHPEIVLGYAFASLWFRSLYGSTYSAVVRCILYVAALTSSLFVIHLLPGNYTGVGLADLVGAIPTMFVTVVVGRHLAGILQGRERTARRDAVHASAGSELLGLTDSEEIQRIGWSAAARIADVTPGLRVLKVIKDGSALRVDGATGGFVRVPETLPTDVLRDLAGEGGTAVERMAAPVELDVAVGVSCAWTCVPMPDIPNQHWGSGWLLLGSPREVPADVVVSVVSLVNQVTLALHNSEVHQELAVQSSLDSLTGLANRVTFNAAVSDALASAEPMGPPTVLVVDLDDFKDVNEVFGHRIGDDLLREVAARLLRATRPGDLCARLGGDEFGVLLCRTDVGDAADIASRVIRVIAGPVHLGADVVHLGASVGIAMATDEKDFEQLIQGADTAMYAAKANGKARIHIFDSGLQEAHFNQVQFERDVSAAARNHELVVYYQPVLSLPGQRCFAAEALVRWQHPRRGLLQPDEFIGTAERIGAIRDIGSFVLRRACADTAAWLDSYPDSPIAVHVNVSGLQLDDDGFIDSVTRCLRDFRLPPAQLVLEFTETVVIASPVAIERLKALASLGVTIAIDDFGTGYSALTTLRYLPVQIVKIDKSFVGGSTVNAEDRALTEAIARLAATMGIKTVAEGVETLEQQAFLEEIGADAAQGFLYLPPSPADAFSAWFEAHLATPPRSEPGISLPAQRQTA